MRNEEVNSWKRGLREVVIAENRQQQQELMFVQGDEYYSDISDEKLDKEKVEGARKDEMKYFERMGVYKRVPCEQAIERTRRTAIGIKWFDAKKPDGGYRSRPVAKEFNDGIHEDHARSDAATGRTEYVGSQKTRRRN